MEQIKNETVQKYADTCKYLEGKMRNRASHYSPAFVKQKKLPPRNAEKSKYIFLHQLASHQRAIKVKQI